MMTVRDMYVWLCQEFNDGKPLPAKFTRKDGYFKLTKGWQHQAGREVPASSYLEMLKQAREDRAALERSWKLSKDKILKARKQKHKVKTKYKGE